MKLLLAMHWEEEYGTSHGDITTRCHLQIRDYINALRWQMSVVNMCLRVETVVACNVCAAGSAQVDAAPGHKKGLTKVASAMRSE